MAEEAYDWQFFLAAGLGLFVAQMALDLLGFPAGSGAYEVVAAAFLVALGGLCLRNWRTCGALHCAVTGPAYLLLALAALAVAAGAPWGMDAVWLGFALVVAVGMGASLLEAPAAEA